MREIRFNERDVSIGLTGIKKKGYKQSLRTERARNTILFPIKWEFEIF